MTGTPLITDPMAPSTPASAVKNDGAWVAQWSRLGILLLLPAVIFGLLANWLIDVAMTLAVLDRLLEPVGLGAYNTRVVVLGTTLLGAASGVVGSFTLLRRRALVGDVLSHSMLPGIAGAFILMTLFGGDGKAFAVLLAGAAASGIAGLAVLGLIRSYTRVKEDTALGLVLSVFFGLGVAMLGVIQSMSTGNAAGLESFIYGKTASMLLADAKLIAVVGAVASWLLVVMVKELALLCFDEAYAASLGWRVWLLDAVLMGLVLIVTVVGLQAVGLILMIAMLVIPAAAARFWTDRLGYMLLAAAMIGAASGFIGAWLSALTPKLPAGAVIVLVASGIFLVSLVIGARRGALRRWIGRRRLQRKVGRQHLLRAIYEWLESHGHTGTSQEAGEVSWQDLLVKRSWPATHLRRLIRGAVRVGIIEPSGQDGWRLTPVGYAEAARVTRNHRLWEMYLIAHADIAPSHVDRDADQIEHVLEPGMIGRLELLMQEKYPQLAVPPSPHVLPGVSAGDQ